MSSTQAEAQDGLLVASRIAADPAFAALEASGAPIVAACGDPLRIVHLNASARAIFGADPETLADRLFSGGDASARRLAELVDSVRRGATLRLERLCFDLAAGPQTVTILCRKLSGSGEPACFVLAALGLRPESLTESLPGAPDRSPPPQDAEEATLALRSRLIRRHGARAPRFLWKTDADGRFIEVTRVLADVAGEESAAVLGRSVEEIVAAFRLDPAFASAMAAGKSWAGLEVDWPLGEPLARAPTTLGGLPIMDADRRFCGFQGYGVIHLTRAFVTDAPVSPEAATLAAGTTPEAEAGAGESFYAADNVVPLRPVNQQRQEQEQDARPAPAPGNDALTSTERQNFEAIARALQTGELIDDAPAAEVQDAPVEAAPPGVAPEPRARAQDAPAPPAATPDIRLLDCLPVGILIARGAGTLYANRTLLDYLGYESLPAFEADGGLARMFFGRLPGDAGTRAAAVQSCDGEALDVDVHLQTVDWDGAPATLVTLRRNRARPSATGEAALALGRERQEKLSRTQADNGLLHAILEASGVAVAVVDDNGRIESATGAFAALFDSRRSALVGLPLSSLFAADDGLRLAARLSRMGESAGSLILAARLGQRRFEATLRRLGPAQRLCVSLREESAAARNDELAAARDAAEQANAAKSDFLARVSHEIRTPLSAIIGFAEVMMEERLGPIGSERYKDYLRDVHASGELVLSLVNDLLDLSKIEAGKMELDFAWVDANPIISECASIMQTQANKARIVMRLALAERLPAVRADKRSLKQILLNLLSNAMKFNEPGGQVIVSSALSESGHVVIRVKDTGIGMSEDEIETALEPFKQVAASHRKLGTGLGLPLTKALIEANHASFTIRSRKNEGTLIEIVFPPPQVLAAE